MLKKNRNKAGLQLPSSLLFATGSDTSTPSLASSASEFVSSSFAAATYKNYVASVLESDSMSPEVAAVGELLADDVQILQKLGEGAGGSVMKCLHKPTGYLMAKKVRCMHTH
jgi:hypothetical protein